MTEQTNNTMYKFTNSKGVEQLIKPELWRWEAHYSDNSVLKQFDDNGLFHQFSEIDQDKLVAFKMYSPSYPQVYVVPFHSPTMKLIHFYRNFGLNFGTPQFQKVRWYCFGYESKDTSKKEKHLLVILPNGEVVMCEDVNILTIT